MRRQNFPCVPGRWRSISARTKAKENLSIYIEAAKMRGENARPRAALWPSRTGQDHPFHHHRQRDECEHPQSPPARPLKNRGIWLLCLTNLSAGRHTLYRRDPPPQPQRGGGALSGDGGLRPGYYHRQGTLRHGRSASTCPSSPWWAPPPGPDSSPRRSGTASA